MHVAGGRAERKPVHRPWGRNRPSVFRIFKKSTCVWPEWGPKARVAADEVSHVSEEDIWKDEAYLVAV